MAQKVVAHMEAMRAHMAGLATYRAKQAEQIAQLTADRDRWGHAAQEATQTAGAIASAANSELARLQARIIDMQDQSAEQRAPNHRDIDLRGSERVGRFSGPADDWSAYAFRIHNLSEAKRRGSRELLAEVGRLSPEEDLDQLPPGVEQFGCHTDVG